MPVFDTYFPETESQNENFLVFYTQHMYETEPTWQESLSKNVVVHSLAMMTGMYITVKEFQIVVVLTDKVLLTILIKIPVLCQPCCEELQKRKLETMMHDRSTILKQ